MKTFRKLLIPYWVLCFVLTHLPPSEVPQTVSKFDKFFHGAGYLGLGFLFYASQWIRGVQAKTAISKSLLLLVGYSFFDEWTQPFVGRTFEWGDLLVDFIGILFGISSAGWALSQKKIFREK